ncbi:MAG: YraN family protein [Bacteroidales bacterium]|jgi:putative endonuclease|nr:YraN family protein [Bacteroidales bacterium]
MNVLNTSKLGELGEQMACDFLETRGHQILDRNWRGGHLEIDIVSEAADGLHFVEVKARKTPVTTSIDDQVNSIKQKRISAAALKYLNNKNLSGREVFFDVVSVLFNGQETTVRYIPQAWIPMYT